jgi:hypothetical protein
VRGSMNVQARYKELIADYHPVVAEPRIFQTVPAQVTVL